MVDKTFLLTHLTWAKSSSVQCKARMKYLYDNLDKPTLVICASVRKTGLKSPDLSRRKRLAFAQNELDAKNWRAAGAGVNDFAPEGCTIAAEIIG